MKCNVWHLCAGALLLGTVARIDARAETNFVSPTGAHVSPFLTWANAATNIQAAVDAATNGNTILVTNGVYEPFQVPGFTKTITIRSVNGWNGTIIDGAGTGQCVNFSSPSNILDGFTIRNGYDGGLGGGGGIFATLYNTIVNCVVVSNTATLGGGIECVGCLVSNSWILDNTALQQAGGIDYLPIAGVPESIITHCVISGNVAGVGGGIWTEKTLALEHTTISGNTASNAGGGVFKNHPGTGIQTAVGRVRNCLIVDNTALTNGGGIYANSTTTLVSNCILYTNAASTNANHAFVSNSITFSHTCTEPLPGGPGNIATNPGFVSGPIGDLHLRSGSPCIDAGTNLSWTATGRDIDGQPRLSGARPDMGCDEAQFVIRAVTRNATSSLVTVDAVVDGAFQIDASPTPSPAAWTGVTQVVTASVAVATLADTNAPVASRMYRAVWLR
ncbi:MAG: choice-of-anchor Q domain-containing protein [bacterium]